MEIRMLPSFICEELGQETEELGEETEIDEGLLADILEKAPEIQWLYKVLHLPEEEVLLMLRENPELREKTCSFFNIERRIEGWTENGMVEFNCLTTSKIISICHDPFYEDLAADKAVENHLNDSCRSNITESTSDCIRNMPGNYVYGLSVTNQMEPRGICSCCLEAELLKPRLSKKKLVQQIIVNTFVGVCPHVLAFLTSDSIILDKDFLCSKLTWTQSFLNIQHLSLLKADVGQHLDDYKNDEQDKFHYQYISSCGGNPLWYALLLDQHTVVRFFIKEKNDDAFRYFEVPFCTQTPILFAVVEKRSIKILKMLIEEMHSEQACDVFGNQWYNLYSIKLYPSLFCGEDLLVFDKICKLITICEIKKFVISKLLEDFLRISLCYCLSHGMKEHAVHLIEKGATLVHQDSDCSIQGMVMKSLKAAEKIVEMNNPEILDLYLKCSPKNVDLCILFEKAVLLGTVDQVEKIFKKKESTLKPLIQQCEIRPATLALLRGSSSMLTFLLKNGIVEPLESPTAIHEPSSPHLFVTRNSLYTWACLLELTDCANSIKSYGFNAEFNIRINPLSEFIAEFHRGFSIEDIKDRQRLSAL